MQAPFSYFGGKSQMADSILKRIPDHKTYVEVFSGAAWILFKKDPTLSRLEVINDLDRHLMNFFRVVKFHPEALIQELESMIPSRDLFLSLANELERPLLTDIQRAAIFFYVQKLAFAGRFTHSSLAVTKHSPPRFRGEMGRRLIPIVKERLANVLLEQLDFRKLISLYDTPDTFFFVDPPYLNQKDYRHNFTEAEFQDLARILSSIKGKFLMTHTRDKQVLDIFRPFSFKTTRVKTKYSADRSNSESQEIFIRNFE